ncbi:acyl-CoA dehydrogenase family protein [Halolamina salifodinae]|uniref:Alkylation response protein AidB-like acyl-CoA dehydrogenase n=1 Tax=Halolamina salifodinae TaxID=1202767 RepID=A0A8T4GXC6_9EURY|nr:acyl-CoA dehydrogenase family protein [Halolamina salifodinae]MBP1987100.1 alkylation response protein AidB-like acyl-CoA dehydrogenase [Halolamina salifodinae]
MDFALTEHRRALQSEAREFAETEIRPRAIELDREEAYPEEILDALGDQRYAGLTLPETYGGRGEGLVELVLVIEELSAALMPVASTLALHLGVATVIERFGTDAQRERFLPEMATFDTVGALGLSEENAGSNKLEMGTTAERDGDGWRLDGHKQWVTNFLDADYVLTYAKTGPDADAPHNVTAFLVPTEAFDVDRVWETLAARPVKSPRVSLDSVHVPDEQRVGEVGEAYVQRGEIHTGVNVPARGVGIARAALADTVAYTTEREQYGRSLSENQGLRWELGKMAERVDAARLLTLRAADRADRGAEMGRAFSMAKINATQAAVDNANDAVQFHGGVGHTTDHHVERYLRDAKLLTIAGGPNEGHKDTLAAETIADYSP